MNYIIQDTVPANTKEANKRTTRVRLPKGVLVKVDINFPFGCTGLAHAKLLRGTQQLFPAQADLDYAADGETINFPQLYVIDDAPVHWSLVTWNLDETFDHKITARLTIIPRKFVFPDLDFARLFTRVMRFFRIRNVTEEEVTNG